MNATANNGPWLIAMVLGSTVVACGGERDPTPEPRVATREARTAAPATRSRGAPARADGNLDSLAVELAATKACDRLRDQFRALPSDERTAATGTVWIRDCVSAVGGDQVSFAIAGNAWQRGEKRGSDDVVEFSLRLSGRLAVTYEPGTRELAIAYEPDTVSTFTMLPMRKQKRRDGISESAILGTLAIALAGPGRAPLLAPQGTDVRRGVRATIPMCHAVPVFTLDSDRRIVTGEGNPGIPVRLEPGGLAMFGPYDADRGLALTVRAARGQFEAAAMCQDDAHMLARARVFGRTPPAKTRPLAARRVSDSERLNVPPAQCPVTLVLRSTSSRRAQAHWQRTVAAGDVSIDAGPLRCTPVDTESSVTAPP